MARKKKTTPAPVSAPNQLSQSELEFLRAKVDKTLMLLDASAMPQEVKTAWVSLLPSMTLEQVDRLHALIEDEIEVTLKAMQERPEEEELVLKLKAVKDRYDAQVVSADKQASVQLAEIEDEINALVQGTA
ncbi:hypothetical protein HY477_01660 [Candidatus Uhrbacteria bacterium]|nr:hypothetical protein [Candidatus Uhrbacteria bacterium]